MFKNSGFTRTLCGGKWENYQALWGGYNRGTSTVRYGCCPIGSFMSNPNQDPFSIANSCSQCINGMVTDVANDELTCQYCPKGYENLDADTTKCQVCSFSKVSFLFDLNFYIF